VSAATKVPPPDLTLLLRAWGDGDREAGERLVPLVYQALRQQAARYLRRERRNHTLRPTALVHEVYLRLVDNRGIAWQNRAHFFAIAAKVMRQVLVDHARRNGARKRSGSWCQVTLDEGVAVHLPADVDVLALESALGELERLDADKGRLVELRFYAGLTIDETAGVLGVSAATVIREWRLARAWLFRRMHGDPGEAAGVVAEPAT
jgi:RNA polymerase sigma factor (TIGR02999 family)